MGSQGGGPQRASSALLPMQHGPHCGQCDPRREPRLDQPSPSRLLERYFGAGEMRAWKDVVVLRVALYCWKLRSQRSRRRKGGFEEGIVHAVTCNNFPILDTELQKSLPVGEKEGSWRGV